MKKPDTVFQIENDISIEQFAVLCILLGMCEADPGVPATTLKYMAAIHYVDNAQWDRDDLVNLVMNGFEGIDKDEFKGGLPIHLAEDFEAWGWRPDIFPRVDCINEFITWAWNNFIMWEN